MLGKKFFGEINCTSKNIKLSMYIPTTERIIMNIPKNVNILVLYTKESIKKGFSKINIFNRDKIIRIECSNYLRGKVEKFLNNYHVYKNNIYYAYYRSRKENEKCAGTFFQNIIILAD